MNTGILKAIGNTTMIELKQVVPPGCARILVKLEWENPSGSMKDRAALAMIEAAEKSGTLQPGYSVVEYTGGSTGIALALVCKGKGYPLRIVTSDAFSLDKRRHMVAFGAELHLVPSDGGMTSKKLILDMIAKARELAAAPRTFWPDQLSNTDSVQGYRTLGEEIWEQSAGKVDAFVHCVGTAASFRGISELLKSRKPRLLAAAVEPAESAVLSGSQPSPHKIEGVGIGYLPPLWKPELADEIIAIPTAEAKDMTRRLAAEEGIFAGTSSGANVLAAIQLARRLGPDATVVTLMADSGLKYLSTDVFQA